MPFEGMLVLAGVPKYQREKIFAQLGSRTLEFKYKTPHFFEVENVRFDDPKLSRDAAKFIRSTSTNDLDWKPFGIEHVLAYYLVRPSKFRDGFVFAVRHTYDVGGLPHIFMAGVDKGHIDLELVRDDHAWSPLTSNFPKCRKLALK